MKCIQEDRVILKLGEDKKSVYATKCCFKPEEVLGGLPFTEVDKLCKIKTWESTDERWNDSYWTLGNWAQDVFSVEPENHTNTIFPQCRCTMKNCDFSQMKFRTVVVNFAHACNLRCKHCFYDKTSSPEIMDKYFQTIRGLSKVRCDVAFTEEGEPFFDKQRAFIALSNFGGELTKTIFLTTNATLLTAADINTLHKIASSKTVYYSFVVSCDGITPETYKNIRGVDKFYTVIQNIKEIIKHQKEDNWIGLDGINFVVQPDNLHELSKVRDFFENIEPGLGKKVNIIPFISDKNIPETKKIEDQVLKSKEWKSYVKSLNKQE